MAAGSNVGARVQGWAVLDQALVLASLAQGRNQDGTFSPSSLGDIFVDVGLPLPGRVSNALATLERNGHMIRGRGRGRGMWKLTPMGRLRSNELLSEMDTAALLAEAATGGAALLGHAPHAVISPALAPPGLIAPLHEFLTEHPFEGNVFGMARFPETDDNPESDPVKLTLSIARQVCQLHGLEFHLASDRAIVDDLWTNVAAHMWASRYGIAFFENRRGRGVNYNLTIEVGSMLMAGRRCALLKDRTIPKLPTDLVGQIYKSVDLDEPDTVSSSLHTWLRDDLALGSCKDCPRPMIH